MRALNGIKRIVTASSFMIGARNVLASTYDIGASDATGGFRAIAEFYQEYINFMTGPFANAAMAGALVITAIAWAFAPKEGLMGGIVRVVLAAFIVLNVTTWLGMFEG